MIQSTSQLSRGARQRRGRSPWLYSLIPIAAMAAGIVAFWMTR